jgi:tRNA modification GTPase
VVSCGGALVDEAILTLMRAPKSYTKEDVVEINCHGGMVILRKVLELVLRNGCRLAEPGEFTKRAFLNGRLDLTQAEAVIDIIRAKTDSALNISLGQLRGGLSAEFNALRRSILKELLFLEASIDFPEENIRPAKLYQQEKGLKRIIVVLDKLLKESSSGRILREGMRVVICGCPNVGKSSLLNALLKNKRSIVTPLAGTTRDAIEETIDFLGVPVRLIDTAGILKPRDIVEKLAVRRSNKHILDADLVLIIFDGHQKLSSEDERLIKQVKGKKAIAVINKMDLKLNIEKTKIAKIFGPPLEISAKHSKNISQLKEAIVATAFIGNQPAKEHVLVSNLRHINALKQARALVLEAQTSLQNGLSEEFVSQSLKEAVALLDQILGKSFSEDLLDKIFSEFCIGK